MRRTAGALARRAMIEDQVLVETDDGEEYRLWRWNRDMYQFEFFNVDRWIDCPFEDVDSFRELDPAKHKWLQYLIEAKPPLKQMETAHVA